jgi:predicted RNase H-like nuclease (RuvC/YqgF family)
MEDPDPEGYDFASFIGGIKLSMLVARPGAPLAEPDKAKEAAEKLRRKRLSDKKSGKKKRDRQDILLETLEEENDNLRRQVYEMTIVHGEMQAEVEELKAQLGFFQRTATHMMQEAYGGAMGP